MNPASAPDEFRAVNALFETELMARRNYAAIDQIYTENATLMPPGAPMIAGRENIRAFWRAAIEAMDPTSGRLETLSLEVTADNAVEIGRATIEAAVGPLEVKYLVVWKRENGSWKLHIDTWNANS